MATQNPIEMEGTYPLPEAQLDRFFFKLTVEYPTPAQIGAIIDRTTSGELPQLSKMGDAALINDMKSIIREVPIAEHVKDYAVRLVMATHPESEHGSEMSKRYVKYGSSPRGAQSLVLAGKVYALLDGRYNVSFEDIKKAALPSLRHRLILNFEGEAEGIVTEEIVSRITESTPELVGAG